MVQRSNTLAVARAALESVRAFDKPSHDSLMSTVSALQAEGHLPKHNERTIFSADPDMHVLLNEASAPSPYWRNRGPDQGAQAEAVRVALRGEPSLG